MTGKFPVSATQKQQAALTALAGSRDRGVLLTMAGWTSGRIAEAFGVRKDTVRRRHGSAKTRFGEDTVRLWRSDFMKGGVGALKATIAPGWRR